MRYAPRTPAEPPGQGHVPAGCVAPILNKVGCSSGPCHGAAKGKNGFKLSLRGYDPDFDYQALLYDLSGRRFNRSDPGRSLMLAKPTQEVAHGGGLRIEPGSLYYKTIYNWIAQGVPFGDPAKKTRLTALTCSQPKWKWPSPAWKRPVESNRALPSMAPPATSQRSRDRQQHSRYCLTSRRIFQSKESA